MTNLDFSLEMKRCKRMACCCHVSLQITFHLPPSKETSPLIVIIHHSHHTHSYEDYKRVCVSNSFIFDKVRICSITVHLGWMHLTFFKPIVFPQPLHALWMLTRTFHLWRTAWCLHEFPSVLHHRLSILFCSDAFARGENNAAWRERGEHSGCFTVGSGDGDLSLQRGSD